MSQVTSFVYTIFDSHLSEIQNTSIIKIIPVFYSYGRHWSAFVVWALVVRWEYKLFFNFFPPIISGKPWA